MPEGYRGLPRLTNLGPISRETKEEVSSEWGECPDSGRERDICLAIKEETIDILEDQGRFAKCSTLREINSGNCDEIAQRVLKRLPYVDVYEAGPADHVWVEYQGRHYDSERPAGVNDPMQLPTNAMIGKGTMLQNLNLAAEYAEEDFEPADSVHDVIREQTDKYKK